MKIFLTNLEARKVNGLEYIVTSGYVKLTGWGMFNTQLQQFVTMREDGQPTSYKRKSDIKDIISQYDGSEVATDCYNNLAYANADRNGKFIDA